MRRQGRPRTQPGTCSEQSCNRDAYAKGLCRRCYRRDHRMALKEAARAGDILPVDDYQQLCAVRGCERPPGERGVCVPHRNLLGDLAKRLPGSIGATGPEVEFEMRRTTLDEIDLGDPTLEMRIDFQGIAEMAARDRRTTRGGREDGR